MIIRIALSTVILVSLFSNICSAQTNDTLWEKLKPYFTPPQEYVNDTQYQPPFVFDNGKKVSNKAQWEKRKKEIRNRWHSMMGQWPAPIDHPKYEITDSLRRENIMQYTIRFYWRADETTTAYLLVPDGTGKRAAVLTLFYEPETGIGLKRPLIDHALQLAKRGFVTLSVGTDYLHKQKPFAQYYPDFPNVKIQPLSMLAYLAGNCRRLLADRPEVDPARIGVLGFSYGSKWAMFSSCLDEKFACAAWIDGGIVFDDARPNVNYWDPWYLGYYPPPWPAERPAESDVRRGAYPVLRQKNMDLNELHALMAPRPFLVSGGSEDQPERWKALMSTVKVNEFLGYQNRVGMSNRPEHMPDEASNVVMMNFFEYFLKRKN
jgi:dienelactone hydrolase